MELILAGMNIDKALLDDLTGMLRTSIKHLSDVDSDPEQNRMIAESIQQMLDNDNLTPETLSAAYARISRDPRPVDQLREDARQQIGKARRSNRSIIFGMGHASVAEHAVFNLDVLGVSRYLSEMLQSHRLISFTEKSQRYIRLDQDYMIPEEIRESHLRSDFETFVQNRFNEYRELSRLIESDPAHDSSLTAEDSRYILPLCVTTQMGMTLNARNLERLLQKAGGSAITEFRQFGNRLFSVIDGIAPSIIKYAVASTQESETARSLSALLDRGNPHAGEPLDFEQKTVRLIRSTPDGDQLVARAILARQTGITIGDMSSGASDFSGDRTESVFKAIFRHMAPWDSAPREFEYVDYIFEMMISAAAYAQLKRHRMATITASDYDPGLDVTIPPVLRGTCGEGILMEAARESADLFRKIQEVSPSAAPYALLACHNRRILMKTNARELIHLSRLREDEHAQWDIRMITSEMVRLARLVTPGCMLPACGKHAFLEYRNQLNL